MDHFGFCPVDLHLTGDDIILVFRRFTVDLRHSAAITRVSTMDLWVRSQTLSKTRTVALGLWGVMAAVDVDVRDEQTSVATPTFITVTIPR